VKYSDTVQKAGNAMVDLFHYLVLFVIGATIVWSATFEYLGIMAAGHAQFKDILLLSITGAIVVLCLSVLVLTYAARRYGRAEDELDGS
jgi:membrane protein DedA with SNARE-associated domain